jgi:hypothetical protein
VLKRRFFFFFFTKKGRGDEREGRKKKKRKKDEGTKYQYEEVRRRKRTIAPKAKDEPTRAAPQATQRGREAERERAVAPEAAAETKEKLARGRTGEEQTV